MNQYRLAEDAEADLVEVWWHIAKDNVEAADKFIATLISKFALLATQPKMGRMRPELAPRLRSFPVGQHIILYRPLPDGVEIARVLHSHMDLERIFEN
jgi:toxin ParE1/3/4